MNNEAEDAVVDSSQATKCIKNYPVVQAYTLDIEGLSQRLQTNLTNGLSDNEASAWIEKYGLNSYKEQDQKSIFLILLQQFNSPIILLLVLAAGFSFFFKDGIEGFSIVGVIFITAALGFTMELQARKSMNALKEMDVILIGHLIFVSRFLFPPFRLLCTLIL